MNLEKQKERAQALITRARSGDDFDRLQQDYQRFAESVSDWAEERMEEARADGRTTLHADDQRTSLVLRALLGDVKGAMADATAVRLEAQLAEREAKANLARIAGVGSGPSRSDGAVGWKAIFPSMAEYKAMSVSNDPAGGFLVQSDAGAFFDRLRPESVVLSAGPRIEPCNADALELPGLTGSTTVYPTAEKADITASDLTLAKLRIPMRKYAIYTVGSSEWFADAAHGPRQIIEMDHRRQLAARLDKDFLEGSSQTGVLGLRNQTNVTKTSLGANGAAPTLGDVIDAIERLERDNARASAVFMHPRTWKTFRKLQDGQSRYQLQPDPTEEARRSLFGVPVYLSSQISITETVGSSTDCSYIIVADMRYVALGRRDSVLVLYDPFSYSKSDQVAIRSTTRWGLGVLHDEAVEVITGVRP